MFYEKLTSGQWQELCNLLQIGIFKEVDKHGRLTTEYGYNIDEEADTLDETYEVSDYDIYALDYDDRGTAEKIKIYRKYLYSLFGVPYLEHIVFGEEN